MWQIKMTQLESFLYTPCLFVALRIRKVKIHTKSLNSSIRFMYI